ncbi:hypothetical protein RN001_007316 [Aquatica leii]|uniref:Uncharacterized protein n=1 Tax=Aquatica leii TaxID=1421715 RepID=A0AAN7Q487_9COLE|nr:hypothetical protein RN001_007316 [Aquatica leii]
MKLIITIITLCTLASCHIYNPYHQMFRYGSFPYHMPNYGSQINSYAPFLPFYPNYYGTGNVAYAPQPSDYEQLNLLAEPPYSINNTFTVVPLFVVAQENLRLVSNALILQVSREQPTMTVKNEQDLLVQCTPAARIQLDKPLVVHSLQTNIIFPSDLSIAHNGFKVPYHVGAVLAPLPQSVYVSPETPVKIEVVYAVPTKPFVIDYVNNEEDVIINIDNQAVIVEDHQPGHLPAKNITILEFPTAEAEPTFQVDEEDEELVNRNPPVGVIPAGIVQSTQPLVTIQQFTNSKESPVLISLREEAAKNRLRGNRIGEGAQAV